MRILLLLFASAAFLLCPAARARGEDADAAAREAAALLELSQQQNQRNHTLALETARRALALWQASGNAVGVARAHAQVARCHFARSDLAEAAESYEQALRIWRELDDPREQADILIMLGFMESRRGEWSSAISHLTRAEGLIGEQGDPYHLGQIASGLADVFNETGLPDKGLTQYRRAREFYRRTPESFDDAITAWALGSTHYLLGEYPEALAQLREALEGLGPDNINAGLCYEYLGKVYGATGEHEEALRHLQSALEIYERAGNPKESAQVRGLLGQVYQRQGQAERARQSFRQALETFDRISDRVNQAAVLYALGRLELSAGDYRAAEDYLRQSIEATENLRAAPASSDLSAAFSATVHERYESYVECLMRRQEAEPERGFAARAFETSELGRARSLAELLRATETSLLPGLDPQVAAREKSLRQALRVKANYKVSLLSGDYERQDLEALDAELARLEDEYRRVNESIRASHPSSEQLARPVAWDLRRIQDEVVADDQTLLLEYSLGEEMSYVWAVTRDRLTFRELPARASVNAAARKVYEALVSPPGAQTEGELNEAAQELSRIILSPVADELKSKRRVVVVADGALNYIPFQLLPSPAANGEPLVSNSEIVNAPSASVLGQLRQETARRRAPSKTLAAFGDPVFANDHAHSEGESEGVQTASARTPPDEQRRRALRDIELSRDAFDPARVGRLFYAGRELANLREVASAGESFVAAGHDATRERLLRGTDLEGFAILHFATHGFLDPAQPEKSGLLLSTIDREGRPLEGFVELQDIYHLRAPVDLVVLSACRTALGKEVRGEGLIGLTRGFMYAGASSVVASLWKVDDEATAELMKRFYANVLRREMTPAAALRDAQNSIRREPQWRAPYYWAAFTLQGEYRRSIGPAPPGVISIYWKSFAAGGALLAACLGAAWLYRSRRSRRASRV
ncbi:MAG TPA: CHAT domain-containing protein [Pyrinomonadaceae bacterium]|nr:CHAT domain-containing protein [Pyrinomonadaceae bacterium]